METILVYNMRLYSHCYSLALTEAKNGLQSYTQPIALGRTRNRRGEARGTYRLTPILVGNRPYEFTFCVMP
jgi:hypothetical protein